jgi:hypothetical protein
VVRRFLVLATLPLAAAASLGLTVLPASADTQTTCGTDPTGCKTVTVDSSGALTSGSTSGTITLGTLTASTTYNLVDVIEGLGMTHLFVGGSYTLSFAGSCASGAGTSGTYTVVGGASTYPTAPPATSGTLPTITTNGSGAFSCAYTLTYPTVDSTNDGTCSNHLCSVRNDIFVMSGSTKVTQLASASVPPGGSPPTSIPEASLPILLPAGIVLVAVMGVLIWRRKLATAS